MLHWARLRQCLDARVTGAPRWYAEYMASGLCRLKWLGASALVVCTVQAFAITHWSAASLAAAAQRFNTTPAVLVTLSFLPTAVVVIALMATGRHTLTIGFARVVALIGVAAAILSQAVVLGLCQIDINRVATFDLTLLMLLAVAPLSASACALVAALALLVTAGVASLVDPFASAPLRFCVHAASYAVFGTVVNLWYRGTFKAQRLAHLRLQRRARQLERQQLRIEELVGQLEEANAAKTLFIASASHDLRQPMHAIGMLVGALRRYITFPDVKSIVTKIESSVEAMNNLFNALLDISKLDARIVAPNVTTFSMCDLLAELELQFAQQAIQKGLSFRVVPSTALVESDPALLRRILMNLVSNAIRYTDRGKILVGCKRAGPFGMRIMVCDTGCGIPQEQQENVFREFIQLRSRTRDRSEGLGLGLAIVRRTAELLRHPITVHSRPGNGSTFAVCVPCTGKHEKSAQQLVDSPQFFGVLADTFVVVVDDEPDILFSMDVLLSKYGCRVVCAESGRDAVTKLQEHLRIPELIITDYRLRGGETGLDVIGAIRHAQQSEIPALLITGSHRSESELTGAGHPVMFKPLNERQLIVKMRQVLGSADQKLNS
jgi:signal transduction histidine kinase